MIKRLLVANRAEIARRIFRTCRDAGIETVAVFSDADRDAPHVSEADFSVRLPGTAPADTYLRGDLLVEAARQSGADAVHPGYGFLSENAEFAAAVLANGLTWIGPSPAAIAAMGSKVEAKELMAGAGVPILARLDPDDVGDDDFPLLVKAAAGGGGRGMRRVASRGDLAEALQSASNEAAASFNDPTVFCEPLLERARHVEVQILADAHGTVWTLGERDCSMQRRHQKVIEETPCVALDDTSRAGLARAAATAVSTIGYVGAGTVEFMYRDGDFYFLEINTRLQVEHPITECVFGLDLVRLQIDIAEGSALDGAPPQPRGHAIEARLYAEDPSSDWLPQTGVIDRFEIRNVDAEFSVPTDRGLRVDAGVVSGSELSVYYDAMLAKVIAWAPTRAAATRRLTTALRSAAIDGVVTNRELLVGLLEDPAFVAAEIDTGFLDRCVPEEIVQRAVDPHEIELSAIAAALAIAARNRAEARTLGSMPSGWRNVASQHHEKVFVGPDGPISVRYAQVAGRTVLDGNEAVAVVRSDAQEVVLDHGAVRRRFEVSATRSGDAEFVHVRSPRGSVRLQRSSRYPTPGTQVAPGTLEAPMPGVVTTVAVAVGDVVVAGQILIVLEAMKMEHAVRASMDGVVTRLDVSEGQQVDLHFQLARLDPLVPEETEDV